MNIKSSKCASTDETETKFILTDGTWMLVNFISDMHIFIMSDEKAHTTAT